MLKEIAEAEKKYVQYSDQDDYIKKVHYNHLHSFLQQEIKLLLQNKRKWVKHTVIVMMIMLFK
jgi:Zn/Cd-binding protein ZinT